MRPSEAFGATDEVAVESRRLFFGVALDDATRNLLAAHLTAHREGSVPGRPVPAANWHVTLRFLGPAPTEQADRVLYEMSREISEGPFSIRFGGLGAFPRPAKASVLWLGVAGGADGLAEVAQRCEDAAVAAGFSPEERPFHPHLTLSRIRPPQNVSGVIASVPAFDVTMPVSEITLYQSHLGGAGARYTVVDRVPL